jgi:hypothetical protein
VKEAAQNIGSSPTEIGEFKEPKKMISSKIPSGYLT